MVVTLFGATGCYTKFNGGWMQAEDGDGRATFGIHYDGFAANGTYHDKDAGVRLKFDSVISSLNAQIGTKCAYFIAQYESQDQANPGSGTADLVACDNGESPASRATPWKSTC